MFNFKGRHKTVYSIPGNNDAQTNVKVTKPDGKVFWVPVEDVKDIAEIIKSSKALNLVYGQLGNQILKLNKKLDEALK